jgi:hypothetical protein
LSNDPIGISGGLNQYVFCNNNPVNWVDPLGLCGGGELDRAVIQKYLAGFIKSGELDIASIAKRHTLREWLAAKNAVAGYRDAGYMFVGALETGTRPSYINEAITRAERNPSVIVKRLLLFNGGAMVWAYDILTLQGITQASRDFTAMHLRGELYGYIEIIKELDALDTIATQQNICGSK